MTECQGKDCWAHIRWNECPCCGIKTGGVVYVFPEGAEYYVDPYCYALPFVVHERFPDDGTDPRHGLIEFVAMTKVMTLCQYRALRDVMRASGWGVLSTRVKDGKPRTIEICNRRQSDTGRTN